MKGSTALFLAFSSNTLRSQRGFAYGVIENKLTIFSPKVFGTVMLCLIFALLLYSLKIHKNSETTSIFVLKFQNNCTIADKFFEVEVQGLKERQKFSNGILEAPLRKNSKLRLVVASSLKDFQYTDRFRPVKNNMVLVADCGVDNSMKETFESINRAFK